jgi:glc operon protein GlcG
MFRIRSTVTAALLLASVTAVAQAPATPAATKPPAPLPYGPAITLGDAHACAKAVREEAARHGWLMVVTVVDSGGNEVLTERMDNAQFGSVAPALAKARTAAGFRRSTKVFEDMIAQGGTALRVMTIPGVIPIDGGLPVVRKGQIIGAVGTSGGTSAEDGIAAAACQGAIAP